MPDVPRLLSQPRVAVPESETAEHENLDGRRSEINFPGIIQEYNTMLLRPTTAAHETAPALAPRTARGDPLVARPAGLGHSRAAVTASETAQQDY